MPKKEENMIASYDEGDIIEKEVEFRIENLGYNIDRYEHIGISVNKDDGTKVETTWGELFNEVGKDGEKFRQAMIELGQESELQDKIRQAVYEDTDIFDFAWQDFEEQLTEILQTKNKDGIWDVSGKNMGWRNRAGEKRIKASTALEVIDQVFPKTSNFTAHVFDLGDNTFSIVVYHHDSPTGETYTFYPVANQETLLNQTFTKTGVKYEAESNGASDLEDEIIRIFPTNASDIVAQVYPTSNEYYFTDYADDMDKDILTKTFTQLNLTKYK